MELSGNTVLITGGSMGIGFAFAEYFLEAKNEVIICGRRENRLLEAKQKHPELHTRVCDVANEADSSALVEWVTATFGNLNILVNNAGIQRDVDFTKGIAEYMAGENEIRINLEAPVILSGLLIPHLTGKRGAAIVNITSGLGFVPSSRMPVYSATKAGLHAFSMALRRQLRNPGIKVFEVVPPAVDTELNPEGRARRGNFRADLKPMEFVESVMRDMKNDVYEISYGMSDGWVKGSRADLDRSFEQMNSRW